LGGSGVTVTLTSVNATTVTATLVIGPLASLAPRSVSVLALGLTSNTVTFTVLGPTVTGITPTSGARGSVNLPVTVTGTNLSGATAVNAGGGITCTINVSTSNSTTVNATCTIAAGAALTTRNVTVTTPIGTTPANPAVTFTVQGPTLTSIAPTSGMRGSSGVAFTIVGANLAGATAISAGAGVTFSGITVSTDGTHITGTFSITTGAAVSTRNVTVTTPNGTTPVNPAVTFTVQGPTLTSLSQTSATHPTTGSIPVAETFTGTNLSTANGLTGLGGGVTLVAGSFHVVDAGHVTATLSISSSATGVHNIGISTSTIGNTNTLPFTVN